MNECVDTCVKFLSSPKRNLLTVLLYCNKTCNNSINTTNGTMNSPQAIRRFKTNI